MIDEILEALNDGEWHGFFEINTVTKIPFNRFFMVLAFLERFGLIEMHTNAADYRLVPSVKEFLQKIKQLEMEQRT